MQNKRRRLLAAKIEGTTGTPETLAAADAAFMIYNATWQEDIAVSERMLQGSLGNLASVPGARGVKITFDCELAGAGTSGNPLWATTFLAGCGMALTTNTFSPVSDPEDMDTLTIALYEGNTGVIKTATGCMGNVSFEMESGKYGLPTLNLPGFMLVLPMVQF
ncbi:MAG: hypothetical protein ABIP54_03725 [Candidatus Andersenbacteria bacterium]